MSPSVQAEAQVLTSSPQRVVALEQRLCPLCRTAHHSRVFVPSRFDPARLDGMSFASRKRPEGMHYRLLECASCDVLYASPVPSPEALVDAYREAEYDSGIEARYASDTYASVLSRLLPELPDLRGAVDIGAGDGAFLARLDEAGFDDVVGFEPSAAPLAAAAPAVRDRIRPEPFVEGALPGGGFSLVSCLQTIEHIPDPLSLCRETLRALTPRGVMLIVCHDRRALSARLLRRRSPIFDIEHLQLFSPQSARELLERAGFEHVEIRPLVNRYPLRYWLRLAPLPDAVRRVLQNVLTVTRLIDVPLSLRVGNLVAVGYKPVTARGS